eukprot:TRINITY_DN13136_c0_g2_i2.p1 TRINITY_DN13136_c0_g2~~TRINITY_DN13136_c0_g2_i2.p1  ORF type:complete len:416 (-),score=72.60 TRINITY_DN13136_c0_g2_i2:108-1355(-)
MWSWFSPASLESDDQKTKEVPPPVLPRKPIPILPKELLESDSHYETKRFSSPMKSNLLKSPTTNRTTYCGTPRPLSSKGSRVEFPTGKLQSRDLKKRSFDIEEKENCGDAIFKKPKLEFTAHCGAQSESSFPKGGTTDLLSVEGLLTLSKRKVRKRELYIEANETEEEHFVSRKKVCGLDVTETNLEKKDLDLSEKPTEPQKVEESVVQREETQFRSNIQDSRLTCVEPKIKNDPHLCSPAPVWKRNTFLTLSKPANDLTKFLDESTVSNGLGEPPHKERRIPEASCKDLNTHSVQTVKGNLEHRVLITPPDTPQRTASPPKPMFDFSKFGGGKLPLSSNSVSSLEKRSFAFENSMEGETDKKLSTSTSLKKQEEFEERRARSLFSDTETSQQSNSAHNCSLKWPREQSCDASQP